MGKTTFMTAQEAKAFGLVDTIIGDHDMPVTASHDARVWAEFYRSGGVAPVSNVGPAPTSATVNVPSLREACPGADDTFLLKCVEDGSTVAEASREWMKTLDTEVKALRAEVAKNKPEPTFRVGGVKALGSESAEDGLPSADPDPVKVWNSEITKRVKKGMSRQAATSDLCRHDSALHAAYIEATNVQRRGIY